tara:strand:+ start:647 stop:2455 length:1809 start_codon:yes stop_codon:yes gene_type:complete
MAAIAIPIVVLGSLYILSEQEKKKENYQEQLEEEDEKKEFFTSKKTEGYSNYETSKLNNFEKPINNTINSYNNSNQHTDKFFVAPKVKDDNQITLMNGQVVNPNTFKHNNMQPYFGAKIRGSTSDYNNTEALLDVKQGYGSQSFSKSEQAPLFKPDENTNSSHGTANNTSFIQSRMNESMKMNNVTLWEPQRVGPGLNQGYGSQDKDGVNVGGTAGTDGFNAGMVSRESWMPKSVNDLRVDTNPKQTFNLNGHQGPANSLIKTHGSNNKIGKVEKHKPEKFYEGGPTRWFTTTGAEHAPPIRSTQVIPMENRIDTTREYYGGGKHSLSGNATYTDAVFEESKKQNLGGLPISNASAQRQNSATPNDFAIQGYKLLPNNRTTDQNMPEMGGVYGMAKAVIAPLLDILQPTRKENAIGNLRESGNVNGGARTGHIYNEYDKTKTTNREMTTGKIDMNYVNVQGHNHRRGHQSENYQPVQNQRDSTNQEYVGGGSKQGAGLRPYNAAYAQNNNVNKTYESRPNQGSMNLFNNHNNISISRDENMFKNNRQQLPTSAPNLIPSSRFIGEMNGPAGYDMEFNSSRMDAGLLSAFKNNPYTQSLNSSV